MPVEYEFGPNPTAVRRLAAKTPVASPLRTAGWSREPVALRERAQFSAGVESLRLMDGVQRKLQAAVGQLREKVANGEAFVDRDSFIADIRKLAVEEGVRTTDAAGAGTVRDIRSNARLGMIYDIQTQQAYNYARWQSDLDPDVLDAYPAQRLTRIESRRVPRSWAPRWKAAGDSVNWDGAMKSPWVALKTSPIWKALSRFDVPWPPYDFGSGMGVEDVDREAAQALGLVPNAAEQPAEEQKPESQAETPAEPQPATAQQDAQPPAVADFNEGLEASLRGLPPETRRQLRETFGDQIQMHGDRVRWMPEGVSGYVDRTLRDRQWAAKPLGLGRATPRTTAQSHRIDLTGTKLVVSTSAVRHVDRRHGADSDLTDRNVPMTKLDWRQLPLLWRNPDRVTYHGGNNIVILWREMPEGDWLRAAVKKTGTRTVQLITMNKTPTGPDGADGRSAHGNPDGKPPRTTPEA